MIRSMTGFGKTEVQIGGGRLTIEIRTLNGKNADINVKTYLLPKDKELLVRRKLADGLHRGTIDFYATWEAVADTAAKHINRELVAAYFTQLKAMRQELSGFSGDEPGLDNDLLCTILRFPDVIETRKADVVAEENWPAVEAAIDEAIEKVNAYRADEGVILYEDVTTRVQNILVLSEEVEKYEKERIEAAREKIVSAIAELQLKPDQSRLEQEMIYYLEKMDINEERVRLRQHCRYFMDTINSEPQAGKKLGFIIQEMGREINTTGSKANHAGIQRVVVRMKEELEKIREQSLNIL